MSKQVFQRQRILIEVIYNPTTTESPDKWNWNELLDMGPEEAVGIINTYRSVDYIVRIDDDE